MIPITKLSKIPIHNILNILKFEYALYRKIILAELLKKITIYDVQYTYVYNMILDIRPNDDTDYLLAINKKSMKYKISLVLKPKSTFIILTLSKTRVVNTIYHKILNITSIIIIIISIQRSNITYSVYLKSNR